MGRLSLCRVSLPHLDHVHHDTPGPAILSKIAHPAQRLVAQTAKTGQFAFLEDAGKVKNNSQPSAMVSNVDQLFTGVLGDDDDGKEQFAESREEQFMKKILSLL